MLTTWEYNWGIYLPVPSLLLMITVLIITVKYMVDEVGCHERQD